MRKSNYFVALIIVKQILTSFLLAKTHHSWGGYSPIGIHSPQEVIDYEEKV